GVAKAVYDLRMETFNKIEGDTETLVEFNIRLIGRQRLLNGTIVSHVDFDDTFEFGGHVEAFINGEWKPTAITGRVKFCTFMIMIYERYFESSFKDSDMPKGREACPFKKGEYYVRNVEMHAWEWATFAVRGLNRFELIVLKNNISYGGFVGTGFLIDRTS
ncbi:hypothetical protein KR054_009045, partial [Drosophila jambulina]